ncbi:hypothetical protein VdG2_00295 [Verticillium dahliae VDG2]|nr:hypothetical protein VdG2_00295 [Verticillium dahliae VDG2]
MGKTIAAQAEDKGRTRGCAQRGVGLTSNDRRLVSDPLHFTGVDLGDRTGATRRSFPYHGSEDEEDDDITSSGDDDDYDEGAQLVLREREEEALVQSALARIQRAQDRGKKEVKLNKEELAALERRRKRIQEEEAAAAAAAAAARRANASASGSERKRRKEKEKRYVIPLAQLEATPRKKGKNQYGGGTDKARSSAAHGVLSATHIISDQAPIFDHVVPPVLSGNGRPSRIVTFQPSGLQPTSIGSPARLGYG